MHQDFFGLLNSIQIYKIWSAVACATFPMFGKVDPSFDRLSTNSLCDDDSSTNRNEKTAEFQFENRKKKTFQITKFDKELWPL